MYKINDIEEIFDSNKELPKFAWPGGYPLFYRTSYHHIVCPKCANKMIRNEDEYEDITHYDANYEDEDLYCHECSEKIECAYE